MSLWHYLSCYQIVCLIILMASPFKETIKKSASTRENHMKEAFLPDMSIRRTSLEMSSHFSPNRFKNIHLNRKPRNHPDKHKQKDKISLHPFSFVSHKMEEPQEFKSNQQANAFIYQNYDILDLSYSLISSQISKLTLFILYMILVIIRYASLCCLVYITIITNSKYWEWIFSIFITYMIYFISMIKVSLRPAQNKCQTILKLTFDSLESNEAVEYFQIIQIRKLLQTICRALIPPQFSFIYIIGSSQMKRIEIYCMINYIYSGIEAIIYYPFFVIYTSIYFGSTMAQIPQTAYLIVMGAILLAESIFAVVTGYLIWYGCKKRGYGRTHQKK